MPPGSTYQLLYNADADALLLLQVHHTFHVSASVTLLLRVAARQHTGAGRK
jgi:hypothetical protein